MMTYLMLCSRNVHGKPKARQEWAVQQLKYAAKASNNLGLNAHATFSGSLLGSISILGHNDQLV
jgi:hypothetical protein